MINERLRLPSPIPVLSDVIGLTFKTVIADRDALLTFDDPDVTPDPDTAHAIREVGLSWDGGWENIVGLYESEHEVEDGDDPPESDEDAILRTFDSHVRDWFRLVTNWLAAAPVPHRAMPEDHPDQPLLLLGERSEGTFAFAGYGDGLVFNPNGIYDALTHAGRGDQLPIAHLLLVEAETSIAHFEHRLPVLSATAALENAYRAQLIAEGIKPVQHLMPLDKSVRNGRSTVPLPSDKVKELNACRNKVAHEGYTPERNEAEACVLVAETIVNHLAPLKLEA